jgi:signal transduction histidine kinase
MIWIVVVTMVANNSGKGRIMQPRSAEPAAKLRGRFGSYRRYTTLRWKTLLIVAATLIGLLVIVYIPLRIFLLGSFVALEQQLLLTDLDRAFNAINDDTYNLDLMNAGYSMWDDTYAFVEAPKQEYIDNNFYDDFLADNRLNLVLVIDNAGRTVFGKAFDLESHLEVPIPQRFLQFTNHEILLKHTAITSVVTGVLSLPNAPMLVSSRPIITSQEQGPVRGALIFGRYLDSREIDQLAAITQLNLTIDRHDQLRPAADTAADFIQLVNEQTIAASKPLADLDRSASLRVRVQVPRSIYAQGLIGINSFLISLLIAGLLFGGIMIWLLERYVLSRLAALQASVQRIGEQSDLSKRIEISGDDELAHLASSINGMLVAIEQAQTEREQAEDALRELQLQEQTLRAKREFLSNVSHELRTPLTPMLGYLDLMLVGEGGDLTDDQRMFLNTIRSNTLRLSVLVEDLLEIGRVEANAVTLQFWPLDLSVVIRETINRLQSDLERKSMILIQEVDMQLPLVEADEKRIEQVLMNLLSNALKYSYPGGRVTVRAFKRDSQYVEVQVEDAGIGLTPEQQSRLFTRFYRAETPFRNQVSGTGLGLSIAKTFVELHGGSIMVQSQAGAGSTFSFTLPLHQPTDSTAHDRV